MCKNKPVVCLDKDKLFVKSGVTVIAALAGKGKTTHLHHMSDDWRELGYEIMHLNFDQAPTYGKEMYSVPMSIKEIEELFAVMMEEAEDCDIVIIDSFKALLSYLGKDVESNADALPLMQQFRALCAKTGISIILVHHAYKPKNVKTMAASFYGSRSIEEQCDSGFIYEYNEKTKIKSVQIVKSRAGHARDSLITIG